MSASSALANAVGTMFSLDVYRRLFRPKADDRQLIGAGRIASAAALVLAALTTPLVPRLGGIFTYFQTGVTYMATPFVSVILLGFSGSGPTMRVPWPATRRTCHPDRPRGGSGRQGSS